MKVKRTEHLTAYQHKINLDVGYAEVIYERVKHLARRDRWAELMKKFKKDFKELFQEWLNDYGNSRRYYISKFNHQKFIFLDGFVIDFLKVFLINRHERFDQILYFILDEYFPMPPLQMPPEPEPPPPPCCDGGSHGCAHHGAKWS